MKKNVVELLANLPFELPQVELEQIFIDASFQPQSDEIRKKNKAFQFWGYDVIAASYVCHLYNSDERYTPAEISVQLQGATSKIRNIIHSRYHLERYLLVSDGERGNDHPQVADRLICLIYLHYGFRKVNDFLKPLYQTIYREPDYKTILQNYAQKLKIQPRYQVLEADGLQHEIHHIVEVRVGDDRAIGEESSKKRASKEAARNFLLKYKIPFNTQMGNHYAKKKMVHKVSNIRSRDIDYVLTIIGIKKGAIPTSLLDTALTHKSFTNESGSDAHESYERLHEVGAYVLRVLCDEYVFCEYDVTRIDYRQKTREFLIQDMTHNILPKKCLDYILQGKGNRKSANDKANNKILAEVQKSLLGAMWLSYIDSRNDSLKEDASSFARKFFEINKTNKQSVDYRSALLEFSHKFGQEVRWECHPVNGCLAHETKHESTIEIYDVTGLIASGVSIGGSKKVSAQFASQAALQKLYDNCHDEAMKQEAAKILRQ